MPFVISPSLAPNVGQLAQPLGHARIGYDNFVKGSTVTATSEVSGFPADAVALSMTYERWQPSAMPATLSIDAGSASDADYIGIAAHTLGSTGATVAIEYSTDNMSWTTVETISPADDSAIMVLFTSVQAQYWRLVISGTTAPQIGVVYIGQVLAMQRGIYGGHSPGKLSRQTTIRPTRSEGGQWLGRSVIRQGYSESYSWDNLTATWYRDNFDPFVEAAIQYPFFVAWQPLRHPSEVLYAWTSDNISPSNSGTRDLMSVGFSAQGLA